MSINKLMLRTLSALSYKDIDLQKNYRVDRVINQITHPSPILVKSENREVHGSDGQIIPVRIFHPFDLSDSSCLLFFHGGGWVSGNVESYSRTCNNLANYIGRRVISVEYRLAPEYKFPQAPEDCYSVARELACACNIIQSEKSEPLNDTEQNNISAVCENVFADLCPSSFTLIGDSAGGNLAAVVSLMARDRGEFEISDQILIYPSTYNDHSENSCFKSIVENGSDYLLTSKKICDYMSLYMHDENDISNPYFAPYIANSLKNQPRTLIITAEFDPLRDEGEAYGRRLRAFGNEVIMYRIRDALHGFFSLPIKFLHVHKALYYINRFLGSPDTEAEPDTETDNDDDD